MNKKEYQLFADTLSFISDKKKRENLIRFLVPIFEKDNNLFSEDIFRDWIDRRIKGESLKGLRPNSKYLYR